MWNTWTDVSSHLVASSFVFHFRDHFVLLPQGIGVKDMSYILACIYVGGFVFFFFGFCVSSVYIDAQRAKKSNTKDFFLMVLAASLWPMLVLALITSLFYNDD
jgi:hypothetical protein